MAETTTAGTACGVCRAAVLPGVIHYCVGGTFKMQREEPTPAEAIEDQLCMIREQLRRIADALEARARA